MNRLRSKSVSSAKTLSEIWVDLPVGRVTYLRGAPTEAIELALEPLPDKAPVVVVYYAPATKTTAELVESILGQLEDGAVRLFPAWLPEARHLEGPGGAGVAAVRALATKLAARTHHFGPYLAALAERALRGNRYRLTQFAPEVRAAELAKVLAASYKREHVALLLDVPDGLDPAAQRTLNAACRWFAAHGTFGVWLAGHPLRDVEHITSVDIELPPHVAEIVKAPPRPQTRPPARDVVMFPPIEGKPRADSPAETLLEQELEKHAWSRGRVWNRPYKPLPAYVIDLMWAADWCAVEIDGPEHRSPYHFERDHRRDVALQTAGFGVLRFTNEEVMRDVIDVASRIEAFLIARRIKPVKD